MLRAMPKAEQDALFKRAAALRRDEQRTRKTEQRRFEDIDEDRSTRGSKGGVGKRKLDPVRVYALKLLAKDLASGRASGDDADGSTGTAGGVRTGVAVMVGKRRCLVREDGVREDGVREDGAQGDEPPQPLRDSSPFGKGGAGEDGEADIECRLPASLAGKQQTELCVGDRVAFGEVEGATQVTSVLQRETVLTRRDPRTGAKRAIVANVDAVVVVVSVVSPPLHPRLIDRYLIAIEDSWVEQTSGAHADDPDPARAIIAVNKADLLAGLSAEAREAELAKLEPYRAIGGGIGGGRGVPVVLCSAGDGTGLDDLCAHLAGHTVAFVGHSGVGKSSLTNALDPALGIRVASVGTAANRGRHTTTSSAMHEIVRTGADGERVSFRVIDTPGIRFFGLDELTPAELRDSFPEIRTLRRGCKFNDCTHTHEPGCAVIEAVEDGRLHPARYETYVRLLEEIERGPAPPTERIRPLADDPSPEDER